MGSNYGPTMLARVHAFLSERGIPLASNQINYSLMYRKAADATVAKCAELDVPVISYFPLANGLLAGAYDADNLPPFPKSLTMKKSATASHACGPCDFPLVSLHSPPQCIMTCGRDPALAMVPCDTWYVWCGVRRYVLGDGSDVFPTGGYTPLLKTMRRIAAANGKSVPQVSLNWCAPSSPSLAIARSRAPLLRSPLVLTGAAGLSPPVPAPRFQPPGSSPTVPFPRFRSHGSSPTVPSPSLVWMLVACAP